MKKADGLLIAAVVLICAVLFFVRYQTQDDGASVRIEVDGELYGTYPLSRDQEIKINNTNVLTISEGEAFMSGADCPDKLCIYQGSISADGELIVCLPNRVVVSVENADSGGEENSVDMIAG